MMKENTLLNSGKKSYNKKELFLGIIFLGTAFVCVFGIFYMTTKVHRRQAEDYAALSVQLEIMNVERGAMAEQAQELKAREGGAVSLEKLLAEGKGTYSPDEANRREGYLWIDRSTQVVYVTLGALQGLTPGDKLTVFDDKKEIGAVRVETPMDVLSSVRLINQSLEDFPGDYYRVVIAK